MINDANAVSATVDTYTWIFCALVVKVKVAFVTDTKGGLLIVNGASAVSATVDTYAWIFYALVAKVKVAVVADTKGIAGTGDYTGAIITAGNA